MAFKGLTRLAACLVLPAMVWGAASDVKTDFDPAIDFTHFRTFAFVGGQEMGKTGLLANPETRERIKNFIAGVMENRGLTEVPRDAEYDLAVRYWVARKQKQDEKVVYSSDPINVGWVSSLLGRGLGLVLHGICGYQLREGTLVVDLLDPPTKALVWRTYLRQKIEDRPAAYVQAKKNLNKSFALFPAG